MKRLLVIYNICGISGFQNTGYYEDALKSVLYQKGFAPKELHLVISSCCSTDWTMQHLTHSFGSLVSYNWIGESLPLTVTFNHTIKKCVEAFGEFDGYLYLDSGINFWDPLGRFEALRLLWDKHLEGGEARAITSAMPSNDDGHQWWGIQYEEGKDHYFAVGQATNLHCQIYSETFRRAYEGRLHCDIFANDTSESVTAYLTRAIHKDFVMVDPAKLKVFHNTHLDGASMGWRGGEGIRKRLFLTEKTMDERYAEGYARGFGYEECNGNMTWIHDPEKFDAQGAALDPELYPFLKRELFLTPAQFDYETITHHFVRGEV